MNSIIERQNQVIISLLARSVLGIEHIQNIVRGKKKKGNPDDFVRAYNALDGAKSIKEIAKIVGVTKQNMGQVLQTWEEEGIVYDSGAKNRPFYVGLLKLPAKARKSTATD